MKKRYFSMIGGVLLLGWSLTACTSKDAIYRPFSPSASLVDQAELKTVSGLAYKPEEISKRPGPDCRTPVLLPDASYEGAVLRGNDRLINPRILCYLSTFEVPGAKAWKKEPRGSRILEPDRYRLSFVEMPEDQPKLRHEQQLTDLLTSFKDGQQDVVVVYIHGWRHDAGPGNGNVRNFRTMLGYFRSALNTRCVEEGAYCKAKLTGVYLSWRGRSYAESAKYEASAVDLAGVFPTVWSRKSQSEKLATTGNGAGSPIVGSVLTQIQKSLELQKGAYNNKADKMLVIGHSFGGNMLATYLLPKALDQIKTHEAGQEIKPLLGDLVVLMNPASEARKWTDLQKAMRAKAGIPDDVNWVSSLPSDQEEVRRPGIMRWARLFAKKQRPTYISITATDNWAPNDATGKKPDRATKILFPMAQMASLNFAREDRTTIGHLVPDYQLIPQNGKRLPFRRMKSTPIGASHDLILNAGNGAPSSYLNSGDPKKARCGPHHGWLRKSQQKANEHFGTNWDSGYNDKKEGTEALLDNMNGAEIQFRHSLWLKNSSGMTKKGVRAESTSQGFSPFWNIRANKAVTSHGGISSFPALCGLSLLWLDNATAE